MYERYHHDVVGVNSRLDSIQAAVLNAASFIGYNKARQNAARKYSAAFEGHYCCPSICDICDCHVFINIHCA
jgi:dTDP-4-amino-4,6-dideoxygalactose transaminase